MKKIVLSVALLGATFLISEEISVFDAGNVNSQNAYGLTENEQLLLRNKQQVDRMESSLKSQQENIEGMRSLMESTNSQVSNLEQRIADLEIRATGRVASNSKVSTVNKQEISDMKSDIAWIKEQIKQINQKLGIQSSAPQKKNDVATAAPKAAPTKAANSAPQKSEATAQAAKTPAEMMQEADSLYKNKKYPQAAELYNELISKGHKPAKSNFMLGEIAYFQGDYNGALASYKKSLNLAEKTDFTPKLLYHSAISLDKIGDTANANKFYSFLKSEYPDSEEAKASPTR